MSQSDVPTPSAAIQPAPLLHLGHPEADHIPFFELPRQPSRLVPHGRLLLYAILAGAIASLGQWLEYVGRESTGPDIALAWSLPFVGLLVAIAVMPLARRHFWERHYHHVAMALALVVGIWYIFFQAVPAASGAGFLAAHAGAAIAAPCGDYISFVFLLGTFFILSGGIVIRIRRKATPAVNTALLLTGTLLANVLGTTGAAVLLFRPYLRLNQGHIRPFHVVFFIFLLANAGGGLLPLGPPLLMGYLRGVPFAWVAVHGWPMWLTAVGGLLAIFLVMDILAQRGQPRAQDAQDAGPVISVFGFSNFLLILAVIAGILLHERLTLLAPLPWREWIMIVAVTLSLWSTPHQLHEENVFNFAPIREVAYLFLGIFITMAPALHYVMRHAGEPALQSAMHTPGRFYFGAGVLSSILDNAPTYLLFLQAALAKSATGGANPSDIAILLAADPTGRCVLAAALGSVFFGAMTYIGNGPNFMVKSMAEHAGIKCPSFFGYILVYAVPLLLPVLVLVWAIFFRN